MTTRLLQVVCLALVAANTAAAAQPAASVPSGATTAAPVPPPRVDTRNLGALVDLIVADAADLPRAEFDPAALANSLGSDPQKIFEWVRDRTWWAPYRGLLRGARGVMLDRVGSNLDRAVLLGDLLRRSGHTVRLAHAQLPEDRARELLGKVRPIPDQRRNPAAPKPVSAERQRAIEAVMPGLEKSVQEQIAASKRRSDEAEALVRSQADQLYAAVQAHASRGAVGDKEAIAALQDHWWVEREENGKWVAMDVLLPDARMGEALAAATTTSEWKKADDAPSIPETDWHAVQIRVVIERYQGGATTESTVLQTVLRPAAVLGKQIILGHVPKPWPEHVPDSRTDPNALKNAALWVNEWVPFLQVGDDLIVQSAFTDGGEVTSADAGGGLLGGGGLMGGMGGALGGGEEEESSTTAEWLDYEVRVPGKPNQHLRRPVFDLLGPAPRSAHAAGLNVNSDAPKLERFEALWSQTDILLQPCEFTGEFVTNLMAAGFIANQEAIRELSREHDPAKAKILASTILERMDVWGPLPNLVLWRSLLASKPSELVIDRPNVLNYRVSLPLASADQPALRQLIDFASNATGVRRSGSRNPFEIRLQQGVADTVAEMLTLGSDLRTAANTASVFAVSGTGPDGTALIGPRDAAAVRTLAWTADAAARLTEDINAGFMALARRQPVMLHQHPRVGWWRVDPASGETIGVMDTGFHTATTDRSILEYKHALQEFLKHNAEYWRGVRAAANNPFTPVSADQYFMLAARDRCADLLRQVALLGL